MIRAKILIGLDINGQKHLNKLKFQLLRKYEQRQVMNRNLKINTQIRIQLQQLLKYNKQRRVVGQKFQVVQNKVDRSIEINKNKNQKIHFFFLPFK
ncbi:hypothetical protein pb186bvf_008914 [Paramecium bursaria]